VYRGQRDDAAPASLGVAISSDMKQYCNIMLLYGINGHNMLERGDNPPYRSADSRRTSAAITPAQVYRTRNVSIHERQCTFLDSRGRCFWVLEPVSLCTTSVLVDGSSEYGWVTVTPVRSGARRRRRLCA
jgi:hypothetical protein